MDSGLKGCKGEKDCLGGQGVLRVSLGCFVSCLYDIGINMVLNKCRILTLWKFAYALSKR